MRILGAAVVVLLLSGCATEGVDRAAPVIPSPTSAAAPAQVFGGYCESVLDPGALRDAIGGSWLAVQRSEATVSPATRVVENVGGLECTWVADSGDAIQLAILPAGALVADEDTTCGLAVEEAPLSCALDVEANELRFAGIYLAQSGDDASVRSTASTIETVLAAIPAGIVPPLPLFEDAWSNVPDCAALAPAGFTAETLDMGTGASVAPAVAALTDYRAFPACGIVRSDPSFGFSFAVLGGGRWVESELLAAEGAEVVDVDGLERVILLPVSDTVSTVNVFDGVNWLQVPALKNDPLFYPALVEVVAALKS
jgi:hypothetical protein